MCSAAKSIIGSRQSDEPFTICDIQFNDPQIAVLRLATGQIVIEFLFNFSIFDLDQNPFPHAVRIRHAFVNAPVCAAFGTYNDNCPGLAFTFGKDHGEPAGGRDRAQQARYFEVRRKPRVHSGRVNQIRQAASRSMLLASSA